MPNGTSGQLKITSDKGSQLVVNDLLVGEVWLGGGQSNMSYDIRGKGGGNFDDPVEAAQIAQNITTAQQEADAEKPPIRYFKVTSSGADAPADDVKGEWILADDKNVADFSAVAWNFGVALARELHRPIGLIVFAVGGTPVEAWMSKAAIDGTSVGAKVWERHRKQLADYTPEKAAANQAAIKAWYAAHATREQRQADHTPRPKELYSPTFRYVPTRLYNGMIHGLAPYTMRGVIWFQADGNAGNATEYSELFTALIQQWRAEWNAPALPFYFVEMNNMHGNPNPPPVENNVLSIIREQQHGALKLPGVSMVCCIDVGTQNAHFPNKKPVGERLAGLALRDCYDRTGEVESPMLANFAVEGGNTVRLKFTHAAGLRLRSGATELKGFAIRGATGPWVWATGKIDGQDILLHSDQVPVPTAVRYAWAQFPIISVENGVGLPLVPFRTDTDSPQ